MDSRKCKSFQRQNDVYLLPEACPLSYAHCAILKLIPDPETGKITIDTKNEILPKFKCNYFNLEQNSISNTLLLNDFYNIPLTVICGCTQSILFIKKCI